MTPNNIVHMAMIKELSLISVTDHNCADNLPAVQKIAQECQMAFLPGMEITTAEEIHLLAYFSDVRDAVAFGDEIYRSLPDIKNRPDIFGEQLVLNEEDEIIGKKEKLLLQACPYTIDDLTAEIRKRGGLAVPAHVNKGANSLIANLGWIPEDLGYSVIEVSERAPLVGIDIERYRLLYSSDAHYILDIAEPNHYINCNHADAKSVIEKLKTS